MYCGYANRLSAFVAKCFHEAREFIPIDDEKIATTLNWLMNIQARNGSFSEPPHGHVCHREMQVLLYTSFSYCRCVHVGGVVVTTVLLT